MARREKAELRVVDGTEAPAKAEPKSPSTVGEAIGGTERDVLVTLRKKIADDIDRGVPAHTLAGLSKQLLELDKAIRAIDLRAASEQEASDERSHEGTAEEAFDSSAI